LIARLALKTDATSLTTLSLTFGRDISTLSHALFRIEVRARDDPTFTKVLDRHLYAIRQA